MQRLDVFVCFLLLREGKRISPYSDIEIKVFHIVTILGIDGDKSMESMILAETDGVAKTTYVICTKKTFI
jgi:hypothetical protein